MKFPEDRKRVATMTSLPLPTLPSLSSSVSSTPAPKQIQEDSITRHLRIDCIVGISPTSLSGTTSIPHRDKEVTVLEGRKGGGIDVMGGRSLLVHVNPHDYEYAKRIKYCI